MTQVEVYQHALVEAIKQAQPAISDTLYESFLAVPRHRFLQGFYERVPAKEVVWCYRSHEGMSEEEWLQAIYQDRPLTIQLDAQEQRFPTSSSSQPGVMAAMLHYIDIQPGHTVLEIGTGTGYNAALLARLTEDSQRVTTIERDEALIEQAKEVVEDVAGKGMHIVVGDGLGGMVDYAPYDRIEMTGAWTEVPATLVAQLATGGRLLLNLRRNLMNVMLLVEKDAMGTIEGHVLPFYTNFMMLAQDVSPYQKVPVPHEPIEPILHHNVQPLFAPSNLNYPDFAMFLQCHLPMARQLQYKHFIYLDDPATGRLIQFAGEEVRGDASLWQALLDCVRRFQKLGMPRREQYTFAIKNGQQIMQLGEQQWVIA